MHDDDIKGRADLHTSRVILILAVGMVECIRKFFRRQIALGGRAAVQVGQGRCGHSMIQR